MTDFRQVWCLHAYSGGTVRDSHPVFYSLVVLLPHPQALKRNIYFSDSIYEGQRKVNHKSLRSPWPFKSNAIKKRQVQKHLAFLAGAKGLEPLTCGFGDRRSTD